MRRASLRGCPSRRASGKNRFACSPTEGERRTHAWGLVFASMKRAGVLASNAALCAEVVPGHAKENERSDVTNDAAQSELFGDVLEQELREKTEETRPTRHPLSFCAMVLAARVRRRGSRVRALCRQVAPRGDCDRACGHQADHPRRTTKARGARERNGSASAAARTAGAVDVRVSVRATEETLRDFAKAKRPAVGKRAA